MPVFDLRTSILTGDGWNMKKKTWIIVAAVAGIVFCAGGASAATVDEEFAFASGLISFEPSFVDLAQKVVDMILVKDPSQKDRSRIIQAEIMIKRRQFAEAEALINEMGIENPKAQAISLALARNFFAIGEMDKARDLYDAFFKQYEGKVPTDPDLSRFYRDAAYQFAQMQEMVGNYVGAEASYKRVQEIETSKDIQRSMMVHRAEALVRAAEQKSGDEKNKLLEDAIKICETIQWGGLDLQFVDSLVVMANVELARGNPDGAKKVLMTNMDIIKPIDEMLKQYGLPLKESPMAGARSLLGRLLKEEADKLAKQAGKDEEAIKAYSTALSEYYNVFVKYGDSTWGPTAGLAAKDIKSILETKYGKEVRINLPDTLSEKAAGTEFMMADNLFRQKKYAEAAAEYLQVLSQFPEAGDLSVGALGNLVQCYMNLDDSIYAKATATYLSERFAGKSDIPAKALVSVAQLYDKAGNAEMSKYMFDRYLQYCPNDPKAGQVLFYLAVKSEKADDQDAADAYLAKIITDYQQDQNYPRALSKRAWKAYKDKDYAGAMKGMALYIKESQPSPNKAQAMFALADCLRQTSNIVAAAKYFQVLVNEISPANNPYGRSREEIDTNTKLLEQARFYLAYSLSRVGDDESRKQAVAKLKEFLELYPQSGLAAKALNLQGSLQMALKDPAANETFARLARDYPNTDEGKNAQYARISGALELGQIEQAHEAFAAMMANAGHYSIEEFVRVGQAMLDKEQWPEAIKAYGNVIGKTEERMYLERALYGIGAAKFELKDYEGAVASLNDLMTRWPNSGLFYQAKFMLARANMASGDLSAAKIALNDVFRYATEPELVNDASLVYADVLLQGDEKTQALATYKRLEYFSSQNMKTEKARAQISTAILAGLELAEELGRTADVIDSCDKYLQLYPTGPKVNAVRAKRQAAAMRLATEATTGGEGTQTP